MGIAFPNTKMANTTVALPLRPAMETGFLKAKLATGTAALWPRPAMGMRQQLSKVTLTRNPEQ